jgi:hypothetical protein
MLDPLSALHGVARSGRLGQPVFLRCHITAPPERALTELAGTLASAAALFEDTPTTLHACGNEAAGALQVALLFRSGSCVLAYTGPGEAALDTMLLGNHGAAYGPATPAAGATVAPEAASEHRVQWASRIRQSLSERRPIALDEESDA